MDKSTLRQLIGQPKTLDQANQVIDLLWETIETQRSQLEALQDQRSTTSQNSSKPPSSDTVAERKQRSGKTPTGRKKGGQPGHKGHYRALHPEADVDQFHDWYPGSCACGGGVTLSGHAPHRRQVIDLPRMKASITEHRLHHGCCERCGASQFAKLPAHVSNSPFGTELHATVALLSAQFHLSDRMVKDYLQTVYDLNVSLGSISNLQGRITPWLWPLAQSVRDYLRQRPWVHADETLHWRNTECRWLWTLAAPEAAYFQTHCSRGKQAATNLLGEDFENLLVVDRLGSYNVVSDERRQFCIPHVIRNFKKMAQMRGIDGQIGQIIIHYLRLLIRIDHKRQKGLEIRHFRRRCNRVKDKLHHQLQRGMQLGGKRTKQQCKNLLRDIACLFTFVQHPGLPLTNNEAERALRPYVIWRKTSFSTKSMRGDQFRAYMLTIVETCKRQGMNALNVLRETCYQGLTGQNITTSVFKKQSLLVSEG